MGAYHPLPLILTTFFPDTDCPPLHRLTSQRDVGDVSGKRFVSCEARTSLTPLTSDTTVSGVSRDVRGVRLRLRRLQIFCAFMD